MSIFHGRRAALVLVPTMLLLASGGGAVGGRMITGADIKDGTITSADIKKGSVKLSDLSTQTQALLAGTTDTTTGTAGTPALAEVVDWSFATTEPLDPPREMPGWQPVAGPSEGTIPTNSRVTFISAEVTGDFTSCHSVVLLHFQAVNINSGQTVDLGNWGMLGSEATTDWDREWGLGTTPTDSGIVGLLTGDSPYSVEVIGQCSETVAGESYPVSRAVAIPPLTGRVVLLVESVPTKPERYLGIAP